MALTPVEVRHIRFRRRPFGYPRPAVEQTLLEIADSFEDVWRSRADLADRVEALEAELVRHKELEALLRTTLVSAERAASELKEQAKREADRVIEEAHAEARAVARAATAERERLARDSRRVRALLRSALDAADEAAGEAAGEDRPVSHEEHWEAA